MQNMSKSYEQIVTKFFGGVGRGPGTNIRFGSDPDCYSDPGFLDPDHYLDPEI